MANSKQETIEFAYDPDTYNTTINTNLDTQAASGFILAGPPRIYSRSNGSKYVSLNFIHQNYVAGGVPENLAGVRKVSQTITHADLTDADTAQDIAIDGVPANAIPLAATAYLTTAFSGGTVSAIVAEVGDAGDPNGLMTSTDVFTGAAVGHKHAPGAEITTQTRKSSWAPIVRFTSTDDNLVNLTAGSVTVTLYYIELETP